jgi:NAD(P)-dependent dehydrogenase (short-subunit alcohol dehydrogenase family)
VISEVIVVIGAGSIGQAVARRVSAGKHIVLADLHQENPDAAAEVLSNAGFDVSTATVDVSSRQAIHALVETATGSGEVTGLIQAAGVSPSQASPERPFSRSTCMALGVLLAGQGAEAMPGLGSDHDPGPATRDDVPELLENHRVPRPSQRGHRRGAAGRDR